MYMIIHSTTRPGTRTQQLPDVVAHSDYRSMLVGKLCDEVESILAPGARLYARVPGEGETRIEPPNNMYAVVAAIDRGCDGVTVELPGGYRELFSVVEV